MKLSRYLQTIRHLKPVQIYARVWYGLVKPRADTRPAPMVRDDGGTWTYDVAPSASMLGPNEFVFLNKTCMITDPFMWTDSTLGALWLFNLHYFDDLNAENASERTQWHRDLIVRWIEENPPVAGPGWSPYTISLRIVNWMKWALAGNAPDQTTVLSLAVQTRILYRRPEVHIQGNHLLANAKALVFGGLFFGGDEAASWLQRGLALLEEQLSEQVLPDGGHYERSPMYQAILLEDLLDVIQISQLYDHPLITDVDHLQSWRETARRMIGWLAQMTHGDGQIALYNDAAFGVSADPGALARYAARLGVIADPVDGDRLLRLTDTGYVRFTRGEVTVIADVGEIGPPHIPAHAHADTLSFELSVGTRRIVVDSGTSTYAVGGERSHQRSTAAHNTVVLDGADATEVWSAFRVARRAHPFDLTVEEKPDECLVACSHDGYDRLAGHPVHRRTFRFRSAGLEVEDQVSGKGEHEARVFLHLHPDVDVTSGQKPGEFVLSAEGGTLGGIRFRDWQNPEILDTLYYPRFGVSEPNRTLTAKWHGPVPFEGRIEIDLETQPS